MIRLNHLFEELPFTVPKSGRMELVLAAGGQGEECEVTVNFSDELCNSATVS